MTDWLTARPIAHRGLHEGVVGAGVVENTAAAVTAAVEAGYGIEVDLQISADGEAFVHHDDCFGRLIDGTAALRTLSADDIRQARYRGDGSPIMTLEDLCRLVDGRQTLVIELKSRFDGDPRLPRRTAEVLAHYRGPAAVMSFDPAMVANLRGIAPQIRRGIVAERYYDDREWDGLTSGQKRDLAWMLHAPYSRPQFIAYAVRDLPAAVPLLARRIFGLPVLTWTVRSEADKAIARRHADQMIFEGTRP